MRFTAVSLVSFLATTSTVWGQLDAKIKAKGKVYFGAVSDLPSSQASAVIQSDFGAITTSNVVKWDATEPSRGRFNFAGLDTLVNYAVTNGKLVRGRPLIWHSQLPSWVASVSDPTTLTSVIQTHVTTIASRYKGKIYAWDVVNEIINEDGSLRTSVFSNVLGENFVAIAFKAARAADPFPKLYINDYNIDSVNAKLNGLVALVNRQKAAGTPIDGIGSETHISSGGAGSILAALTKLATTGVDVAITELSIPGAPSADYASAVTACLNVARCVGLSTVGVCDQGSSNSLLFNANCQKKPAYSAVISALS